MKSFFKKLAFVMALAMVISMAAPAAQAAVAADKALAIGYQNGSAITEVNLTEVGDEEDLRFLYAPANWKELGAKWSSSNENVVTVDDNGLVKAIAAGSAVVSVAVGTETASVTVNVVDLPTYTVKISDPEGNLVTEYTLDEVGDTVDFAFKGVKDYSRDDYTGTGVSRYFCQWDTTDDTVAKVNQSGLVEAVAPGKAKITLIVWNLETGKKHDVDACWVTVPEVEAPEAEEPEQDIIPQFNKTQNTFEIRVDKNVKINLETVKVWRVFTADDDYTGDGLIDDPAEFRAYEDVYVRDNFYYSAADEAWIVETFDDLIDGVTYEVEVKGYEREQFTASVGDVASVIVFEDTTKEHAALATDDQPMVPGYVYVKLFDKNKVDVTTRVVNGVINNDPTNVIFYLTDETTSDYAMTDYNEVSFYEMSTAGVMATFDNNGNEVVSAEPLELTPTEADKYGIKRVVRWTLVKPNGTADWAGKVSDKVPSGEYGWTIATLLEDTRGNYFTTHQASAGDDKYTDENGVKHDVYYTEDENRAFWIYGYRVEYRAMQADNMLVEDYGDIASYEEGPARFSLYLYNQFETAEKEFQRELFSNVLTVCHPMKMTGMDATKAVSILTNTEYDEEEFKQLDADAEYEAVTPGVGAAFDNAYYSLYSVGSVTVSLKDGLHDCLAKEAHAKEAVFELELITGNANQTLKDLIDKFEDELNYDYANDDDGDSKTAGTQRTYSTRTLKFGANDFVGCDKSQVKFKITEKVTGAYQTVTITLKTPELEETVIAADGTTNGVKSAKVATIEEYSDFLKTKLTFEKFTAKVDGIKSILLEQSDRYGNKIGVDNNLLIATTANPKNVSMIEGGDVCPGDRVLIITGPDGKIFPSKDDVYGDYKNPNYTAKVPTGYEMPQTTLGLFADVTLKSDYAQSASGDSVDVNMYTFGFVAAENLGNKFGDAENVYAKAGRYTVTIKTVKAINPTTGDIEYTKSTGVTTTITLQVSDPRQVADYSRRDLTRINEDAVEKYHLYSATINDYNFAGDLAGTHSSTGVTKNREYGDDVNVKELILAAFDFKLGGSTMAEAWYDNGDGTYTLDSALTGGKGIDTDDILYYTYTYTGTNKQVVINSVTFKVKDGNGFYRVTADVNKSLTFDFEY